MDTIHTLSVIAGLASFAAGISSVMLRRMDHHKSVENIPKINSLESAKSTADAIRASLAFNRKSVIRLRILFLITLLYGIVAVTTVMLADASGGHLDRAFYVGSVILGIILCGLLLTALLLGYRSVQLHQSKLDEKIEEVSRLVHH